MCDLCDLCCVVAMVAAQPRAPVLSLAALQTWLCAIYPFLETEDASL